MANDTIDARNSAKALAEHLRRLKRDKAAAVADMNATNNGASGSTPTDWSGSNNGVSSGG
jgi:hypothetical protein